MRSRHGKVPLQRSRFLRGGWLSLGVVWPWHLVGDSDRAQRLADELAKGFPKDTVVNFIYLPTIRGQIALSRHDFARAIEELKNAAPFELGQPGDTSFAPSLYPGLRARRGVSGSSSGE